MEFGLLGGVENKEHNGIGFVDTSNIFVMQGASIGTEPFDGV